MNLDLDVSCADDLHPCYLIVLMQKRNVFKTFTLCSYEAIPGYLSKDRTLHAIEQDPLDWKRHIDNTPKHSMQPALVLC